MLSRTGLTSTTSAAPNAGRAPSASIPEQRRGASERAPLLALRRLFRIVGADRALTFAAMENVSAIVMGVVTALLVATRFSSVLQGYYYSFIGLAIVPTVVEFGLGQTLIQFASHERSRFKLDRYGNLVGEAEALSRLASLGRIGARWYGLGAPAISLLLIAIGYIFFGSTAEYQVAWRRPWISLCVMSGLNYSILPAFYLLQGCNEVAGFWYYRLILRILGGVVVWVVILLGGGLWCLPALMLGTFVWSISFLVRHYRTFVVALMAPPKSVRFDWRADIWPLQRLIAVTWSSDYLAGALLVPVLFRVCGPILAGQMGLTRTMAQVVIAVSTSWVTTKAPGFGILAAQRKLAELKALFRKSMVMSILTAVAGAVAAWILTYYLYSSGRPLAHRLLPSGATALFMSAAVLECVLADLVFYLRAQKREPLAAAYAVCRPLAIVFSALLAARFGALGAALGYFVAVGVLQFPFSIFIFQAQAGIAQSSSRG